MSTVTKESDEKLHELLVKVWEGEGKRPNIVGPKGLNYKVYTPDDDTVVFAPQTGLDGTYGERSTKGITPK
jgi:hypothetical protein